MPKVDKEVAEAEVIKWLDRKKVLPGRREKFADHFDTLVDATSNGNLVFNDDGTINQELSFPLGEKDLVSLKFKFRINDKDVKKGLKGVANDDGDARLLGYVTALTDEPRGILENLDSVDKSIAVAIAIFFM